MNRPEPPLSLPWLVLALFLGAACRSRPIEPAPPGPGLPTAPGGVAGTEQEPKLERWKPPVPDEDDYDWIQLKSGEWLKGEIRALQKDRLEFESDELDDLTFDWEDVTELRTSRLSTVRLDNDEIYLGTVLMRDNEVVVGDGTNTWRFRRAAVLTMIPGRPRERNYWAGKLSFGLQARTGNVDQVDYNGYFFLTRRTIRSRWDTTYNGTISTVNDAETNNTHRLQSGLDVYLTRRFYVTPLSVDVFRDPFQNTDLRVTPGVGAGYSVVDRGDLEWNIGGGLGLRYTRFSSVSPGESPTETTSAALVGTDLDWDLTKRVELKFNHNAEIALEKSGSTNQHASLILSLEFLKDWDVDLSILWDRVGNPVQDENGNVPASDDVRFSVGLGWEF